MVPPSLKLQVMAGLEPCENQWGSLKGGFGVCVGGRVAQEDRLWRETELVQSPALLWPAMRPWARPFTF